MTIDSSKIRAPERKRTGVPNLSYHTRHVASAIGLSVDRMGDSDKTEWDENPSSEAVPSLPRWIVRNLADGQVVRYEHRLRDLYRWLADEYKRQTGEAPFLHPDEAQKREPELKTASEEIDAGLDGIEPTPEEPAEAPAEVDPIAAARAAMRAAQES